MHASQKLLQDEGTLYCCDCLFAMNFLKKVFFFLGIYSWHAAITLHRVVEWVDKVLSHSCR